MNTSQVRPVQHDESLLRYSNTNKEGLANQNKKYVTAEDQSQKNLLQNVDLLRGKVKKVQEMSDLMGHSLQFDVREEADIVQIVVKDSSSGDVIKEIPPERIVKFLEGMKELLGSLFDEKF